LRSTRAWIRCGTTAVSSGTSPRSLGCRSSQSALGFYQAGRGESVLQIDARERAEQSDQPPKGADEAIAPQTAPHARPRKVHSHDAQSNDHHPHRLPAERDEFKRAQSTLASELEARNRAVIHQLESLAKTLGFGVRSVQGGVQTYPILHGKPVSAEQFDVLDDSTKRALSDSEDKLAKEVEKAADLVRAQSAGFEAAREAVFSKAAGAVVEDAMKVTSLSAASKSPTSRRSSSRATTGASTNASSTAKTSSGLGSLTGSAGGPPSGGPAGPGRSPGRAPPGPESPQVASSGRFPGYRDRPIDGVGLPKEDRARLTEPYVTHKPKGTGLGLAIVKKIMEDHGGTLTLGDQPDGPGAVAILVLPRVAAGAPGRPAPNEVSEVSHGA